MCNLVNSFYSVRSRPPWRVVAGLGILLVHAGTWSRGSRTLPGDRSDAPCRRSSGSSSRAGLPRPDRNHFPGESIQRLAETDDDPDTEQRERRPVRALFGLHPRTGTVDGERLGLAGSRACEVGFELVGGL